MGHAPVVAIQTMVIVGMASAPLMKMALAAVQTARKRLVRMARITMVTPPLTVVIPIVSRPLPAGRLAAVPTQASPIVVAALVNPMKPIAAVQAIASRPAITALMTITTVKKTVQIRIAASTRPARPV